MTTQTLAIERMLWVQCQHCGGLMVPEHVDDSVLDADTCEEPAWHCLSCSTSVAPEGSKPFRSRSGREGRCITYYFSTLNRTRRVA